MYLLEKKKIRKKEERKKKKENKKKKKKEKKTILQTEVYLGGAHFFHELAIISEIECLG